MTYTKQQAEAQFRKWSRSYDRSPLQKIFFAPSHRILLSQIEEFSVSDVSNRSLKILDVGCGTGVFAQRLKENAFKGVFWGVDFSRDMLDHALGRSLPGDQFYWIQGDSQRLPFPDNSLDMITCVHSFHHYPNQSECVYEMHRVLAPGGCAMILDADRDGWWGRVLYDMIVVAIEGDVYHPSRQRFQELFHAAGFDSIEQHCFPGLAPMLLTTGRTAID